MNKNFLLAFSLILLSLIFFNSSIYNKIYEKIFKTPRVTNQTNNDKPPTKNATEKKDTVYIKTVETRTNIDTLNSLKQKNVNSPILCGDTIWVENEKLFCGISEIGGKIISIKMKDYFKRNSTDKNDSLKNYLDLISNGEIGGGNLTIDGQNFDEKKFKVLVKERKIKVSKNETKDIDFFIISDGNNEIIKRYSFDGNSYKIGFKVLSNALNGKSINFGWKCGITESENQNSSAMGISEPRMMHVFDNKNVTHIQMKKIEKEEETGFFKWAAITSKYFMVAMVAEKVKNSDLLIESIDESIINTDGKKGNLILNYSFQIRITGDGISEGCWIYAGPSKLMLLKTFNENLEKVLFNGWEWLLWANVWFPVICEWTLWLLIVINGILKDYGISILILTIITRVITYPLSQSSMKSMSRMKDLQPKISHIRERYKTNPKKMNEEVMALYKQEGVNPFNPGCLPMFLQMPILIALFIVLRKAIELRGAHTVLIPWVKDLSQPESLISLTGVFPNGIWMYGNSIALLPIIMAILTFFQNKMTIKDPNQKMMIYFMPIFMLVLFNNFPAGLVLYWTFSNALGILQQYMLEKSLKGKSHSAVPAIVKGPSGKRK